MDYEQIGSKIKEYRKNAKLTHQQLVEAIGRTEISIRKYEKANVEIPNSVLSKIADILIVDTGVLLGLLENDYLFGSIKYFDKVLLSPDEEKLIATLKKLNTLGKKRSYKKNRRINSS